MPETAPHAGRHTGGVHRVMPAGDPASFCRRVVVLGSTGSIGRQTLDVLAQLNTLNERGEHACRYEVAGLAAGTRADELAEQATFVRTDNTALAAGDDRSDPGRAALDLVERTECDIVVAAIVGAAGLPATLRAVELGRDIALANKETLVAAGSLVMEAARASGSRLLPVDSEHAGVWQAVMSVAGPGYAPPSPAPPAVRRAILTASGGAFRDRTRDEVRDATIDEALAHPNWSMGPKVTIDSATLINKALELIEAHWLFGLSTDRLGVLLHRQSAVHAVVEMVDGSLVAQLGQADMRTPIRLAMTAPSLACCPPGPGLNLAELGRLDFEEVDPGRFPAIGLAFDVINAGGDAGATFNAANEAVVAAFLAGRLPFGRIDEIVAEVVADTPVRPVRSLADVTAADAAAREAAESKIGSR